MKNQTNGQKSKKNRRWKNPLKGLLGKSRKKEVAKEKSEPVGRSVTEIAEEMGCFPSDAEAALKRMSKEGKARCFMYHGELYGVILEGEELKIPEMKDESDSMYA